VLDWVIVAFYLVFVARSFCSPLLPTRVEFVGIIGPLSQALNEPFEVSTLALASLAICTSLALVATTILAGPAVLDLEDGCQIGNLTTFHSYFISFRAEQSKRAGSSNGGLTKYVSVHDHCLGHRGLSLAVILILCHGRVHFVVE
jgi:hypothetical protein